MQDMTTHNENDREIEGEKDEHMYGEMVWLGQYTVVGRGTRQTQRQGTTDKRQRAIITIIVNLTSSLSSPHPPTLRLLLFLSQPRRMHSTLQQQQQQEVNC